MNAPNQAEHGVVFVAGETERGIKAVLPFAVRTAAFYGARLQVWQADPSAHELGIDVEAPAWLQSIGDELQIEVETVAARDVPEAIEQFARRQAPVVAFASVGGPAAATPYFRNLVSAPPCPLLLMLNAGEHFAPTRVLLAMNTFGRLSETGVRLSYVLANCGPGTHVTFLRVVASQEGDDARRDQETRLRQQIETLGLPFSFDVQVTGSRTYETGVLEALEDDGFDLVIGDTPRSGLIARFSERTLPQRLVRAGIPLLLHTAPSSLRVRTALRAWNWVYRAVPSTEERDRVGIYTGIRRRSRSDADYFVMLALSVTIATFGLLLDSAAVVIGAMIVAPLMQPIIGIGLGTAMGNARLINIGTTSVAKGVLAGLLLSTVVGLLVPGADLTGQLEARGQPAPLDLMIALASGAAGAYASCRKGVADTVAGVAIAVALVPPLSTAGVGIALAEWPLAMGAALLLGTNFIAIAASSALMFLWMGFKPEAGRFRAQAPLIRGLSVLAILTVVVALSLLAWARAGDARFDRQIERAVEAAVQSVEPEAAVQALEIRHGEGSTIVLCVAVDTLDVDLIREAALPIQSAISIELGRPVELTLRAFTLRGEPCG